MRSFLLKNYIIKEITVAVETLYASQQIAAELMDIDHADIAELQAPRLAMEATVNVDGREIGVFRAHSGPTDQDLIAKGGIRMSDRYVDSGDAIHTVEELAVEMLSKLALRGHNETFMGGKGLILVNGRGPLSMRAEAMRKFAQCMDRAGLAGHDSDVPAGDVGVGPDLIDEYARQYHHDNPDDPNWQASITGKSPKVGGAEFRPAATGWGTYISQLTVMKAAGQTRARTTIQGFGNVGGFHAGFASNDPEGRTPVGAISDVDGIIYTDNVEGIMITDEMVKDIANNPDFARDPRFAEYGGRKIVALSAMVAENQPTLDFSFHGDSRAIISYPTGYFVPAAMGNVITGHNANYIGARYGIIEAGNGVTTPDAHRYLTETGLLVVPDILANGTGVDCSIAEWHANMQGQILPTAELQASSAASTESVVNEVIRTGEVLGTLDMRVAAAALGLARLLSSEQPELLRELVAA